MIVAQMLKSLCMTGTVMSRQVKKLIQLKPRNSIMNQLQ
jgi:hypothetical protein